MGRLVYRSLRNLYPVIVAGLVKARRHPRAKRGTSIFDAAPAEAWRRIGDSNS
jgi:hypothetical protein